MKNIITVSTVPDDSYRISIMVGKITKFEPTGSEWTDIFLSDGTKQSVHHTVEELIEMMQAKF